MKRFVIFIILANLFCVGRAQVEVTERELLGQWEVTSVDGDPSRLTVGTSNFHSIKTGWKINFSIIGCTVGPSNHSYNGYFITSKNILNILNSSGIAARFVIIEYNDNGSMTLQGFRYPEGVVYNNEEINIYLKKAKTNTRVEELTSPNDGVKSVYNLKGEKLDDLEPGINIVKESSGTSKKVVKK